MKKIFTILLATMVVAVGSVYAADNSKQAAKSGKPYNHSIGIVAGSGLGVQYKAMITDHFTLIEEFGYLGSYCAAGANGLRLGTFGATNDLVLAYQAKAAEGQGIELDWFIGGQLKAGYIDFGGAAGGQIGIGAAAGIDAKMKNAPIAFSFDFRPGYGCVLFGNGGGGVNGGHVFDWTINLGVRYAF